MPNCDRCGKYCQSSKYLVTHQRTAQYCLKYQNVLFMCIRCGYRTKGIKNIDDHITTCTEGGSKNVLEKIDEEKRLFQAEKRLFHIKKTQFEKKEKQYEMETFQLRMELKYEKMKNIIFEQIIENCTDIKIDDLVQIKESAIHLFNYKNGNIPVVVHDFFHEGERIEYKLEADDVKVKEKKSEAVKVKEKKPETVKVKEKKSEAVKVKEKKPETVKVEEKKSEAVKVEEKKPETVKVEEKKSEAVKVKEKKPETVKKVKVRKRMKNDKKVKIRKKTIKKSGASSSSKKIYRSVESIVKLAKEDPALILEANIDSVDSKYGKIIYDKFDVSHKDISDTIEELFIQIASNRVYSRFLSCIKKVRKKLMGKLKLDEYMEMLSGHNKRLEEIFKAKDYTGGKIKKVISKSLTSLDMRLLRYGDYINTHVEVDDINRFVLAIEISTKHKRKFVPFYPEEYFCKLKNYTVALQPLEICIERTLFNRYRFNNIIYLQVPKSKPKDPFSFYTLEQLDTRRCWKMDCRLEDLTLDLIENVLPYCIKLFRDLYRDVFNDNEYRPEYVYKSQITELDCEQLLQNIILLSQPYKLSEILRCMVIDKSTFIPYKTDKFNLYADDKLQQRRFATCRDTEKHSISVLKRVFNNISDGDLKDLAATRI